jgi:uncharacterized protein (DUF58 family)
VTLRGRWTARGWAVAVLGTVLAGSGGYWRYPGLIGLGVALAAVALAALAMVRLPARLSVHRTVAPLEVPRYGQCTGILRIARTGGRLRLHLDAAEQVDGVQVPVPVPALRPGEDAEVSYPIPTQRRGALSIGPVRMSRHGLAGLAAGTAPLGGTVEVRVLPRVLPVRGLPGGVRRGHVGAEERVERGGTDLVGLREYVPGDDLRRLHWATSARTGTLMVREDADPARAHLLVLLDDDPASYADADLEDAVEVAASLASAAAGSGHPVRLRTLSGQLEVSVPDATASDLVAALATLGEPAGRGTVGAASGAPAADRDVLAMVTGARAPIPPMLLEAGRASVGVILVIDRDPVRTLEISGGVVILRGPRADDLLAAWDQAVVGPGAG